MRAHALSRRELVVAHATAAAADPSSVDLFTAPAVLKAALRSRDMAREAHAAQRVVDEARALVQPLERG